MNFFNKILEKVGLRKPEAAAPVAPTAKPVAPTAKPVAPATAAPAAKPAAPTFTATASFHPNAVSEVDVVKNIEKLAAGSGLNWKVSIVDFLKILGVDSSLEARKALATELNCPADLMKDSAKMNVWLHKEVLKKIAENGGNIPQSLLS